MLLIHIDHTFLQSAFNDFILTVDVVVAAAATDGGVERRI
jgi:hypothetical protein